MNLCDSCGYVFEKPRVITEYHNELDGCPTEEFYECPNCGGEFTEAVKCDCGEWISENRFKLCAECKKTVIERFRAFKAGLTENELDFLNDYLEDNL